MEVLSKLTEKSFQLSHPVALSSCGTVSWEQLLVDVSATRSLVNKKLGHNWGLFEDDSYRFLVGLLALLAESRRIHLPGENHAAVVEALQGEGCGLMGMFPTARESIQIPERQRGSTAKLVMGGEIVVFTSGSTGKPKLIPKSLSQIDAELFVLESLWGEQLGNASIVGTVSHQHFYGFLFSVVWPLCSGRSFWRRPFIDPVLMAREVSALPSTAWIMSPAHLHRLNDDMPWVAVRKSLAAIFSSGGPLEAKAAQSVFDASGRYPVEIFGSSETGAIAWRRQLGDQINWQPLPGVRIRCSEEGALVVSSPFLPTREWYATADAVTLDSEGGFVLGARLDRIVKIEGKRVSLPEVEALLRAHKWIADAVAVPLKKHRSCVGAVLVLEEEGEERRQLLGHQKFIQTLRADLSKRLPAIAIPRNWRLVSILPRNAQGKFQFRIIEGLFEAGRLPQLLEHQVSGASCRLRLYIASNCPYFEGHFQGTPVLPGVAQVMWAEHFARELLGVDGPFLGMRAIKFKKLVHPGSELILTLDYSAETGRLDFSFVSSAGQHSQGRMNYRGSQ